MKAKKKPTCITLTPAVHLKLKVNAAGCKKSMGDFIEYLLSRFEDRAYTVAENLQFLKFLEEQAKEAETLASTVVDKLQIKEAVK